MVNKVSDKSDEGSTSPNYSINYWSMKNFWPFFSKGNNIEFEKWRQEIGYKAATKIQTWRRSTNPQVFYYYLKYIIIILKRFSIDSNSYYIDYSYIG